MLGRHYLLIVLISSFCSCFSSAATFADPAGAAATYQVDTAASRVFIKVGKATALGHPHGVEGQLKSGTVSPGAGGDFIFDMASFTADSPESRKRAGLEGESTSAADAKQVTDTMRGKDVLDVARFPIATFHLTAVTPLDHQASGAPGMYQLEGKFTLHGVERDLPIKARLESPAQPNGSMKLSGSFKIKQSDYGIKPYSTMGGAVRVSDELEISGDLLLKPAEK